MCLRSTEFEKVKSPVDGWCLWSHRMFAVPPTRTLQHAEDDKSSVSIFYHSERIPPCHRLKVLCKLSPWVDVTIPVLQGNADPSRTGEYLSYFQIFPGKGAHYIIRQSFPVSQNPRHSWYQTFPAAPEVNFFLVSKCFVRPLTLHTLRGSCYNSPPTPASLGQRHQVTVLWVDFEGLVRLPLVLASHQNDGWKEPTHLLLHLRCSLWGTRASFSLLALPSAPFC